MNALLTFPEIETLEFWAEADEVARMVCPGNVACDYLTTLNRDNFEFCLVTTSARIFIRDHNTGDTLYRVVNRQFCCQVVAHFAETCDHDLLVV